MESRRYLDGLVIAGGAAIVIAVLIERWRELNFERRRKSGRVFQLPQHVEVHHVNEEEQLAFAVKTFLDHLSQTKLPVLGLDAEWRPHTKSTKNKVALLQLSNGKHCLLLHLIHITNIPQDLLNVLQDPNVIKTGVGITNDVRAIWQDYGIEVRGCVDLQPLAHKYDYTGNGAGLASLAHTILTVELDKSHYIRCSNWERKELSSRQKAYAAADAWIGREIFVKIYEIHNESVELLVWIEAFVDRKPQKIEFTSKKKEIKSEPERDKTSHIPARKTILYENCRMLSPEGELLCTCNLKKINWYLDRGIADLVSDDPPTIRLKFAPKGKGHIGDPFYLSPKENKCVVCGSDKSYIRHSVVPHAYRTHLDEKFKSRSSHDIVLLCPKCSQQINHANASMKEFLAKQLNAPITGSGPKFNIDNQLYKARNWAKTLSSDTSSLPKERLEYMRECLKGYLHKEEITQEDMDELKQREYKILNPEHKSHEELAAKSLKSEEEVEWFVKQWRSHFVKTMKPKHLPPYWSVDHPIISS